MEQQPGRRVEERRQLRQESVSTSRGQQGHQQKQSIIIMEALPIPESPHHHITHLSNSGLVSRNNSQLHSTATFSGQTPPLQSAGRNPAHTMTQYPPVRPGPLLSASVRGTEGSGERREGRQIVISYSGQKKQSIPVSIDQQVVHQGQSYRMSTQVYQQNVSVVRPPVPQYHSLPQTQPSSPPAVVRFQGPVPPPPNHQQEVLLWQSRFFTLVERFEVFGSRFEVIAREFAHLRLRLENGEQGGTQSRQVLEGLDQRIQQTEQQLTEAVQKNRQLIGETVNWKEKFLKAEALLQQQQTESNSKPKESQNQNNDYKNREEALMTTHNQHLQQLKEQHTIQITKLESLLEESQLHIQDLQKKAEEWQKKATQWQNKAEEWQSKAGQTSQERQEEISTLRLLVEQQKAALSSGSSEEANAQLRSQLSQLRREKEEASRALRSVREQYQNYRDEVENRVEDSEMEIRKKDDEIKRYQYLVQEKSQRIEMLGQSLSQSGDQEILLARLQEEARFREDQIKAYQRQIGQLEEQAQRTKTAEEEAKQRQRQLQELQGQYSLLEEEFRRSKGSAISRGEQATIDLEELNSNMVHLQKLYQEKCLENEQLRNQQPAAEQFVQEIEQLRKQLRAAENEQERIRDACQTEAQEHTRALRQELSRKEQEALRARQTSELLQANCDQLSLEIDKARLKTMTEFKASEGEKSELRQQLVALEFRTTEAERKGTALQEIRTVLEQQLVSVTTELHAKLETVQRLETELRQERSKVKTFQADLHSTLTETEENRLKLKESEKKSEALIKSLQHELDRKKEESVAKTSEVALLKGRLVDLEKGLREKEARISELEKHQEVLRFKMNGFDNYLEEIKHLKQKVSDYEARVSSLAFRPLSRSPHSEPTQIFERKVIYQLKLENEALRHRLGLASPPADQVRDRLSDFNHRLEEVIGENHLGSLAAEQSDLFKRYERDRRRLIERHNEQIAELKVRILQLSSWRGGVAGGETRGPSAASVFSEQILFYKSKNQELQERVDSHIKVNKDLRDSLERLMRGHSDEYSIIYYKDQLTKSEAHSKSLAQQLKRASQELTRLREETTRAVPRSAEAPSDLEVRITELNRRVSQQVVEITQLEQEKTAFKEQLQNRERQCQKHRTELEQATSARQELLRRSRQQESLHEEENSKAAAKLRQLNEEVARLNELLSRKSAAENSQTLNLKSRLQETQQELKKTRSTLEDCKSHQELQIRQHSRLQTQSQSLQNDLLRAREQSESAVRRSRELEAQLSALRLALLQSENRLRSREEEWSARETQLGQEIARIGGQTAHLQAEAERSAQFWQRKVNERESEATRLRALHSQQEQRANQLEEQLIQVRNMAMRTAEQKGRLVVLEEEASRLSALLSLKTSECDRKTQQVLQLQSRLALLEQQVRDSRRWGEETKGQLQLTIRMRESLEQDKRNAVADLETRLRRLQEQKDSQFEGLRTELREERTQVSILRRTVSELQLALTQSQDSQAEVTWLREELQRMEIRFKQDLERAEDRRIYEASIADDRLKQESVRVQAHWKQQLVQSETQWRQQLTESETNWRQHLVNSETQWRQQLVNSEDNWRQQLARAQSKLLQLRAEKSQQQQYYTELIRSLQQQLIDLKSGKANSEGNAVHLEQLVQRLQSELTSIRLQLSSRERDLADAHQELSAINQRLLHEENQLKQQENELRQRENNIRELEGHLSYLQGHLSRLEGLLLVVRQRSDYTIEFLRSVLISIETVLQNAESLDFPVSQSIGRSVNQGLQECQAWHTAMISP